MSLTIDDFVKPEAHPYGLLEGYRQAFEKENVLAIALKKCIELNAINATFETIHNHPTMVNDGLLTKVSDRRYCLTRKSIGLLFSRYGKNKTTTHMLGLNL